MCDVVELNWNNFGTTIGELIVVYRRIWDWGISTCFWTWALCLEVCNGRLVDAQVKSTLYTGTHFNS